MLCNLCGNNKGHALQLFCISILSKIAYKYAKKKLYKLNPDLGNAHLPLFGYTRQESRTTKSRGPDHFSLQWNLQTPAPRQERWRWHHSRLSLHPAVPKTCTRSLLPMPVTPYTSVSQLEASFPPHHSIHYSSSTRLFGYLVKFIIEKIHPIFICLLKNSLAESCCIRVI